MIVDLLCTSLDIALHKFWLLPTLTGHAKPQHVPSSSEQIFPVITELEKCSSNQGIQIYTCTIIHRYRIFRTRYSVMCKVYTGYCGTSEIEHGLCACTVDNPLAKARGLSLRTGAQTMLYLSLMTKVQLWPFFFSFVGFEVLRGPCG